MSVFPLSDLLEASFAGEWGTENGENRVQVLRTANFNEDGSFDYFNPAWRCISEKKVMSKTMRRGDIVLEKSGGTPKRPVGIMAYYDSDDLALCSNFNHILRLNPAKVSPRYAFHQLRWLKEKGAFEPYTRKTTGLQNLQMKKFAGLKLKVPPDAYQRKVISILDFIVASRIKHHREISNLQTLVKSRFIEMFGDPNINSKGLSTKLGSELFKIGNGKTKPVACRFEEGVPAYGGNGISWYTDEELVNHATIIIGRVGRHCGNTRLVTEPCWVTDNAMYIKDFKGDAFDLVYLSVLMEIIGFNRFADAGDLWKITQKPFMEYAYPVPAMSDQKAFAFFARQAAKLEFVAQRQNADPVQYNTHRSEEER